MKFIPIDKMKKLREAARNGDVKAKFILNAQLKGDDFGASLDEYFAPKPEPQKVEVINNQSGDSRLEKFLADNGITKESPEYNDAVNDFYAEIGGRPEEQGEENDYVAIIKKLMKEESGAIDDYSKAITELMNLEGLDEDDRHRAISRFKEIRGDEETHFRELNELLNNSKQHAEKKNVIG